MDFSIKKEPLYIKVKKAILKAIASGKISEDNQLASEKVLCEKFNVSRATIRSALQSLEADNVIRKHQGVGTFIIPKNFRLKMRIDKGIGFYQLIRDSGRSPSIRKESISNEIISDELKSRLDIAKDIEVICIKRTFFGDDDPAIYSKEYIPTIYLKDSAIAGKIPVSIFELADKFCPERIEHSISEIIPTIVNSTISKELGLPQRQPILMLEETHFNRNNTPIIFSEVWVNDLIIRFNVFRARERQ